MNPTCCLSVDLDSIDCYYAIHGFGSAPSSMQSVVLERGLPRFLQLFERLGIQATFFVVAKEVETRAALVAELVRCGHEIGNHSYGHPYDLGRWPRQLAAREIKQAHEILLGLCGREAAPMGFRAPGYGLTPSILSVIADLGYRYDSSMFPSWPYFTAKALIMGWMRLSGSPSAAILQSPRNLLCPRMPYRPDSSRPWQRGQSPVVEIPVSVLPWTRLPAIGTGMVVGPGWWRKGVIDLVLRERFFNFELHGIDLCDALEDQIPAALVNQRPDLRVPLQAKQQRLEEVLRRLAETFSFALLKDVAASVQRHGRI